MDALLMPQKFEKLYDYDHKFLDSLPANIDPCWENGEFHTFVSAASCFFEAIIIAMNGAVKEDGGLLLPT